MLYKTLGESIYFSNPVILLDNPGVVPVAMPNNTSLLKILRTRSLGDISDNVILQEPCSSMHSSLEEFVPAGGLLHTSCL